MNLSIITILFKIKKKFEKYIFNLIEKLIMAFSYKQEVSQYTKFLIHGTQIINCIKSYNSFNYQLVQKYLNKILEINL